MSSRSISNWSRFSILSLISYHGRSLPSPWSIDAVWRSIPASSSTSIPWPAGTSPHSPTFERQPIPVSTSVWTEYQQSADANKSPYAIHINTIKPKHCHTSYCSSSSAKTYTTITIVPSFQPHKLLFSVRASVIINFTFQSASDCSGAIDWLSTRLTARRARPLESAEPIPALYPPSDITEPGARASARRGTTRAPRRFTNSPWPSCSGGRKGANKPYQKCG